SSSVVPGLVFLSTAKPPSRSFFRTINQRGLSANPIQSTVKSKAGKASTPSIQRQSFSPIPPSRELERNATRIPKTILNWNIPARRPRYCGGAISEMYIGAATVEIPTPRPPINRKSMNEYTSGASAEPTADTRYSTPIQSKVFFRPKCSEGQPPTNDPITVPQRAILIASPCKLLSRSQSDWIVCSAPEITTVSNPKRNPARDATTALLYKKNRSFTIFNLTPKSPMY